MKTFVSYFDSPVGPLEIISSKNSIVSLSFSNSTSINSKENLPRVHQDCLEQLQDYFSGQLKSFKLALNPSGTDFQKRVWNALSEIPYGTTTSYGALSELLGNSAAIRAVASAIGGNKIAIIIPCHRVIGSDGSMTGFAGGIPKKEWLLQHEGALSQLRLFSGYDV